MQCVITFYMYEQLQNTGHMSLLFASKHLDLYLYC